MSNIPGIAKAVPHPAVRCGQIPARVGSGQTAAAGNTRLGSDPGGTPSGRTATKMKSGVS